MRLDIPTKLDIKLYKKTVAEIAAVPDITVISDSDDYELISVMADGEPLKRVIDIVLKSGIAE